MLRSLGRLGEAVTTLEAAVEQLPAGVSPDLVALLHQALAFAYCVRGELGESARATDEALRLAPPGEVDARSSALLNRGQLALIRLEPSAARAVFRSVREYAEEHRSGYYQVWAWAALAAADIALGEVAGAAEALGRAQTLQGQVGERSLELQLAWTDGDLALR
jgi:ATP/maltotriose-dependent transcriptional regulator MalT